jgi:hypothetical protein
MFRLTKRRRRGHIISRLRQYRRRLGPTALHPGSLKNLEFTPVRVVGGGQLGCQYQWNSLVFGLEHSMIPTAMIPAKTNFKQLGSILLGVSDPLIRMERYCPNPSLPFIDVACRQLE